MGAISQYFGNATNPKSRVFWLFFTFFFVVSGKMRAQGMDRILICTTPNCGTKSTQDDKFNRRLGACEVCHDEACKEKNRETLHRWKDADDAKKIALEDAQKKGTMVLMC